MAQRSVSSFKSTKNSRFADNTTGQISEGDSRDMYEDVADSFLNITDHLLDEDDMASDSASKVPSQQSVKAYVDNTAGVFDTDLRYFEQDDFLVGSSIVLRGWLAQQNGTGAGLSFSTFGCDGTENVVGSILCATGTTTGGRSTLSKGMGTGATDVGVIFGNGHTFKLRMRCALEDLSDGTDTYTAYIGFGDTSGSGDMVDGVYFRYTHGTNSGKWECVTSAASTETATDSTVAADTTFHIFEVRVNAAGTSATFYVDGVLKVTTATNIPTGTNFTAMLIKIEKSAGTTSRNLHMDYYDLLMTRTVAR